MLLLYKNNFMIDVNELLPFTEYYIEHRDELVNKYSKIPVEELFCMRCIIQTGYSLW